ncbi:hypothetical protein RxyAA322_20050 [Rubrobacter xylanophilus]|uniref:Yip1 domain-containing protein n=1 Tax=Rubrobacter xylanophilus TaxID=49319 RepID=A0A510HJH1_9ACTN|nr:YIP1 family protein [Rubrobacter xylanophilus]BBL80151.1 hypothetical protein RxyAA322_20050 [Rubrobacter xylanophilus]
MREEAKPPEFDPGRPLGSALKVLRAALLSPRRFYAGLPADGPVREPALFTLLVGAFSGLMGAAVSLGTGLAAGNLGAAEAGITLLQALLAALLSPAFVGVVAAVYLLAIRTFVGRVADFRGVYRISAYAFGAMALAWIPALGALAVTYSLMVLMGFGVRYVYRTSSLTALVTALSCFVPLGVALIWLRILAAGMVAP